MSKGILPSRMRGLPATNTLPHEETAVSSHLIRLLQTFYAEDQKAGSRRGAPLLPCDLSKHDSLFSHFPGLPQYAQGAARTSLRAGLGTDPQLSHSWPFKKTEKQENHQGRFPWDYSRSREAILPLCCALGFPFTR